MSTTAFAKTADAILDRLFAATKALADKLGVANRIDWFHAEFAFGLLLVGIFTAIPVAALTAIADVQFAAILGVCVAAPWVVFAAIAYFAPVTYDWYQARQEAKVAA